MNATNTAHDMALLTLRLAADDLASAIRACHANDHERAATAITEATNLLAVALNRL